MESQSIFICYRRTDSADVAGRIYDRLAQQFGRDYVYKDVDSTPIGVDFRQYLDSKVALCGAFLAIIGRGWLKEIAPTNARAKTRPIDFVRIELESALRRKIPVIPVLIHDAQVPSETALPEEVRALAFRQAIRVRGDPDFHRDVDRLIEGVVAHFKEEALKAEAARKSEEAQQAEQLLRAEEARKELARKAAVELKANDARRTEEVRRADAALVQARKDAIARKAVEARKDEVRDRIAALRQESLERREAETREETRKAKEMEARKAEVRQRIEELRHLKKNNLEK